jgi:hypothetical protein
MSSEFTPGDHVRWFAKRRGWQLAKKNILVEGENDQKYFELAACLYEEKYHRQLIGTQLAIFPTGSGDKGGAYGIQKYFRTFRHLIEEDLSPEGMKLFHAIALLDNDPKGKQTYRALTARHTEFHENRDLFLLYRKFPRNTREPNTLTQLIEKENQLWKRLDCEIEDLLSVDLLKLFVNGNSDYIQSEPIDLNGAHHFKFKTHAKALLFRFVEENASLEEVIMVVEVLKSLRFYLGLEPDGELIKNIF